MKTCTVVLCSVLPALFGCSTNSEAIGDSPWIETTPWSTLGEPPPPQNPKSFDQLMADENEIKEAREKGEKWGNPDR